LELTGLDEDLHVDGSLVVDVLVVGCVLWVEEVAVGVVVLLEVFVNV
jgi:hypothetical protein